MSIIAFNYFSATRNIDRLGRNGAFPSIPIWNYAEAISATETAIAENFYYTKFAGSARVPLYPLKDYAPTIEAIDYTSKPNNREFWFRFCYKATAHVNGVAVFINTILADFIDNVTGKLVARLNIDASDSLLITTYTTAAGDNIATTNTVKTFISDATEDSNYNKIIDIRILLDPVAGFVQVYDYAATKIGEFIGSTWNGVNIPTHVALNLTTPAAATGNIVYGWPVFAIAADESTMGMFVTPLFVKAEGSLQQQEAGTGYTNLNSRRKTPVAGNSVDLVCTTGVTKKYTAKLQDMTDRALPANYVVRSFKFAGVFEGAAATQSSLPLNLILKTGGVEYPTAVANIVGNVVTTTLNNYQVREAVYNVNPSNSNSWQVTDFANIEVGYSFTGV